MQKVSAITAIQRGFILRCPCCGRGRLLQGYISPINACSNCSQSFEHMRADDGPAWLTILIVGHLMVPIMFMVFESGIKSSEIMLLILLPIVIVLCGLILPRAKGIFMAIIWLTRVQKSSSN